MLDVSRTSLAMSFTTVHAGVLSLVASDFAARPLSAVVEGERSGYEPAVARAVCQKLGLEPRWHDVPMADLYNTLSSGDYDAVWFSQAISHDTRAWADFTRPYGRFDDAVLVLEESPIFTANDLANQRLGSLANSSNRALVEDFPDLELVPFAAQGPVLATMLDALLQGKVDAILGNALMLLAAEADDPAFRVAFQLPTQRAVGVGVLPGNRELVEAMNAALNELILEGTLAKLWAQWIPYKPFPF